MSIHKVSEIFIAGTASLDVATTALPSLTTNTGIVGPDMLQISLSASTIALAPTIFLVDKLANGDFKRSNPIVGTHVTGFKAESYKPARRCVGYIGYHRGSIANQTTDGVALAAGGTITVSNSTEYQFSLRFKNDKSFYSERPEILSGVFTSAAAATQLTIATQIAAVINGSSFGASKAGVKEVSAVVIGDGTAAYGLTGATNYGVEITGAIINQFQNTQYGEEIVNFSVHVNDASGFGSGSTAGLIQLPLPGTGTYNQVYNMENKFFGTEGVLNRRLWPIPVLDYLTASAGFLSGAFTQTAATTIGYDLVTFSATTVLTTGANQQLFSGSYVSLDAVIYEVKYIVSTSVCILTAAQTSTNATGAVIGKAFYDIVNINVEDKTSQDGSGIGQNSKKNFFIAVPANVPGATGTTPMSVKSAAGVDIQAALNAWMATTPLAPAAIAI